MFDGFESSSWTSVSNFKFMLSAEIKQINKPANVRSYKTKYMTDEIFFCLLTKLFNS